RYAAGVAPTAMLSTIKLTMCPYHGSSVQTRAVVLRSASFARNTAEVIAAPIVRRSCDGSRVPLPEGPLQRDRRVHDPLRPPYPPALFDDLRARVPICGSTRLLDVACGTGQVALALAADVGEVWAVDQEPESVAFGREKAGRLGIRNIHWVAGS